MKKSIAGVLVLGSLAISVAAASCAQSAPAAVKSPPALTAPTADVRRALEKLEEQRVATQKSVDACVRGGQPAPSFEYAILESIEQARLELLKGVGLVE